jgi:putative two-component system response regulator
MKDRKKRILVIDDEEIYLHAIIDLLAKTFKVIIALNGREGLKLAQSDPRPDLILLDVKMPEMDGYAVCERLKSDDTTKNIPVIFLTAMKGDQNEAQGLELGAVDYVTKPFSSELLKARVRNQLELKQYRDHLEMLVRERTHQLELTQEVTIESLGSLAEYRDPETGGHIKRTKNYVRALARQLKDNGKFVDFLDDDTIEQLFKSAPLHDIGKVGVPDSVLLKPGKLTEEEFEEMKKHTTYGRDAIRAASSKLGEESFLKYAEEIAYTHQEKWDGSGYPEGLKGDEIPISGRMMAIADVYDALISKRIYKPPLPHPKAVAIIKEGLGQHFDPDMVDAFRVIEEDFRQIALEYADFEEERQTLSA